MLSSCSFIFKVIVISSVLVPYVFKLVFLTLLVENNTKRRGGRGQGRDAQMLIIDMHKNILHLHVKMVKKENKMKSTFINTKLMSLFSISPVYKLYIVTHFPVYFHTFQFGSNVFIYKQRICCKLNNQYF